jgi:hypothetical protein
MEKKVNNRKEDHKTEGPSCACGKEDLYEVWKKSNEIGVPHKEEEEKKSKSKK